MHPVCDNSHRWLAYDGASRGGRALIWLPFVTALWKWNGGGLCHCDTLLTIGRKSNPRNLLLQQQQKRKKKMPHHADPWNGIGDCCRGRWLMPQEAFGVNTLSSPGLALWLMQTVSQRLQVNIGCGESGADLSCWQIIRCFSGWGAGG